MPHKKRLRIYIPRIIGAVISAALIYFMIHFILGLINSKAGKPEKKIQPVTILKPPPPPPPPPKTEPPPPPEVKQKIEEPEPEPEEVKPLPDTPDDAPAKDLGLDAEGTAGSDAFGLAAHKGGTGLFGGGGGDPHMHFAASVKNEIEALLAGHDELKRKSYSASVKIRFKSDGSVEDIELIRGSNDPEIDDILSRVLSKYRQAGQQLPAGMKPSIKFKISSRI
jgi:periplasmic protein TonB